MAHRGVSRVTGLLGIGKTVVSMAAEQYVFSGDPLKEARNDLPQPTAKRLARQAREEVDEAVESALNKVGVAAGV